MTSGSGDGIVEKSGIIVTIAQKKETWPSLTIREHLNRTSGKLGPVMKV